MNGSNTLQEWFSADRVQSTPRSICPLSPYERLTLQFRRKIPFIHGRMCNMTECLSDIFLFWIYFFRQRFVYLAIRNREKGPGPIFKAKFATLHFGKMGTPPRREKQERFPSRDQQFSVTIFFSRKGISRAEESCENNF